VEAKPTVTDVMVAYAQDAVDHARSSSGVALDYSFDSIRDVEDILENLHRALPPSSLGKVSGKRPTQEDIETVSKMYGGYIGEVFRKVGGGEWSFDEEVGPGQNYVCLRKGDLRIWPPSKVYKRITNGSEDNVWHYSQAVMKEWK
jgi:hypothetical protein